METMINPMPESCETCPCNNDDYDCNLTRSTFDYDVYRLRRMDDCPLKSTGEWIDGEDNGWWKCSECGEYALEIQEWGYRSNYCPHCGARMENSEEEE